MKRVRQESAEFIEVTGHEIAQALGLTVLEGDTITLTHKYGANYTLKLSGHTTEDTELIVPTRNNLIDQLLSNYVCTPVRPPFDYPTIGGPLLLGVDPQAALEPLDIEQAEQVVVGDFYPTPESLPDTELPGMWEKADFTGGADE